jgi:hypothetical protein
MVLGRDDAVSAAVPVDLDPDSSRLREELRRGMATLKTALEERAGKPTEKAVVHLTLLPPLADSRILPFPPLRKSEVEVVVRRDVARHFLGASRPQVVGVRMPRRRTKGAGPGEESVPVLAAAAPMILLETLRGVLTELDWKARSFSPAHSAWLDAVFSRNGPSVDAILAVAGPTVHLMRLDGPDPVSVRKLPRSDSHVVSEALSGVQKDVLVLADTQALEGYRTALAAGGFTVVKDPSGWSSAQEAAAARAASRELELVPPSLAGERAERGRRTAVLLAVAAVVLVLGSLAVHLWGVHRELGVIQAERAAIRSDVAPLISARDSLADLTAQVESMDALARNNPVWTRFLVELSAVLPEDTHLTGFFASGDTVEVEAAGDRAGEAIQALSEAGLFQEIRLQGLVEREMEDGETVVERFRLWGRVPETGWEGEGL